MAGLKNQFVPVSQGITGPAEGGSGRAQTYLLWLSLPDSQLERKR